LEERRIRAFDFLYEVGHGTRRMTRRYDVVVIETDRTLPAVLMWSEKDIESAPLEIQNSGENVGGWFSTGQKNQAQALKDACLGMLDPALSLQTCGESLMLFAPAGGAKEPFGLRLQQSVLLASSLERVANCPYGENLPDRTARSSGPEPTGPED